MAWLATSASYCARLCACACGENDSAAMATSALRLRKFFIKYSRHELRLEDSRAPIVATAGQGYGEKPATWRPCVFAGICGDLGRSRRTRSTKLRRLVA